MADIWRRQCEKVGETRLLPIFIFGLSLLVLSMRITMGVDFMDESYYACFVDGWLKTGLRDNSNLMIHQTAELLVYPMVYIFNKIFYANTGLILFLRFIYLAGALISAICFYCALRQRCDPTKAALIAAVALNFIPFYMPAPSYNTIAMYALLAAMSQFWLYFHSRVESSPELPHWGLTWPLWLSAIFWVVACIAYPTMLVSLLAFFVLSSSAIHGPERRQQLVRYALICVAAGLFAGALLMNALGVDHLWNAIQFTNAASNYSGGAPARIINWFSLFAAHPWFSALSILVVVLSLIRKNLLVGSRADRLCIGLFLLAILTATALENPTLYVRSHDVVFLLALCGFGTFLRGFKDSSDGALRLRAALYFVSLMAGIVCSLTALGGIYNFPIGGLFAACLSLSNLAVVSSSETNLLPNGPTRFGNLAGRAVSLAIPFLILTIITALSATGFYGQIGKIGYFDAQRIRDGVFAGLRTDSSNLLFIVSLTKAIEKHQTCGNKLLVLGANPAIYLLTPMSMSALSSWNIGDRDGKNFAIDLQDAFYAHSDNLPDVIVLSGNEPSLTRFEAKLLSSYFVQSRVQTGINSAAVYVRADCH